MATIGQRYKDVLLSLAVAHNYGVDLGRLQLQKFIYLSDILSIIWETLAPRYGHYTYKNGPYDSGIQDAVDVLAFRGCVSIIQFTMRSGSTVTATYRISDIGLIIVNDMIKEDFFNRKYDMYKQIAHQVNKRGWDQLRNLVYSEASYSLRRADGNGQRLYSNSILKNESLRIILGFKSIIQSENVELTRKNLSFLFFDFLDNHQHLKNL